MGVKFNPFSSTLDVVDSPSGDFSDVELNQGTAAAPSISFNGDPNTGIYSPGADQLAISTNGTGRLFVDANGDVGVGTASLGNKFEVAGNALLRANGQLKLGDATNQQVSIIQNSGAANTSQIEFLTGSTPTERLRITSDGKLGVGTSSPISLCHISGPEGTYGQLRIQATGAGEDALVAFSTVSNGRGIYLDEGDSNKLKIYAGAGKGAAGEVVIDNSGRVGIGTTSVSAGLHVVTDVNPVLKLDRGTANSTNANLYYNGTLTGQLTAANADFQISAAGASTPMSFYVNGSQRAAIDTSGRLLVGTSGSASIGDSQYAKLQVRGNTISDTGIFSLQRASAPSSSGDAIGSFFFTDNSGNEYASIKSIADATPGGSDYPGRLVFSTTADGASSPTERLRIDSSGRVGIGTTTPSSVLHLKTASSPKLILDNSDSATAAIIDTWWSGAPLAFNIGTTERARIDGSGRLLVGTSSSFDTDATFQAVGGSHTAEFFKFGSDDCNVYIGSARGTQGSPTTLNNTDNLGTLSFRGHDGTSYVSGAYIRATVDGAPSSGDFPTRLVFSTTADGASSPTERMRIGSDGLIQVSNGRLYVQVSEASSPLCHLYNTNNAASDITYRSELGAGSNGTSAYHFYGVTGGSGKFAIYGNGTYGTISDQNLKTHIEPARDGYLADLNQIKIVKYGWKSDELGHATELGVIAQEVEQVFPGLVQESPPNEDGEVFKGVKTSVFTFMLIKALQEASSKIESLESRIAALEAQ